MPTWRESLAKQDWDAVENAWRWLPATEQRELLSALKELVPTIVEENGLERLTRHKLPGEVPDNLRQPAMILLLGELESAVLGPPPNDIEIWKGVRDEAESRLAELMKAPEVTEGAQSLSRRQHVVDAIESLGAIDVVQSWMRKEMDSDDDRAWLEEIIAAVAWNAFVAGQHSHAALNKAIELSAIRGEKVAGGQKNSAHKTNELHKKLREKRLSRMEVLIPSMGVDCAAAQCESEDLGRWESIKRQYNRWKKRDS